MARASVGAALACSAILAVHDRRVGDAGHWGLCQSGTGIASYNELEKAYLQASEGLVLPTWTSTGDFGLQTFTSLYVAPRASMFQ